MDEVKSKGKWNQFKGRLRDQFGRITGNRSQQAKGKGERVGGKVQEGYGEAREKRTKNPEDTH